MEMEETKMKLKTCLEIAKDCNLETVGEALFNISLQSVKKQKLMTH